MTQPNLARGESVIELAGARYIVRPSMQMLAELEGQVGGVPSLFRRIPAGEYRFTEIAAAVAVMLNHATNKRRGDEWTPEEVGEQMLADGLPRFAGLVVAVLTTALTGSRNAPEPDRDGEGDPPGEA